MPDFYYNSQYRSNMATDNLKPKYVSSVIIVMLRICVEVDFVMGLNILDHEEVAPAHPPD